MIRRDRGGGRFNANPMWAKRLRRRTKRLRGTGEKGECTRAQAETMCGSAVAFGRETRNVDHHFAGLFQVGHGKQFVRTVEIESACEEVINIARLTAERYR